MNKPSWHRQIPADKNTRPCLLIVNKCMKCPPEEDIKRTPFKSRISRSVLHDSILVKITWKADRDARAVFGKRRKEPEG